MKIILDWVPNHTGWDHHWIESNPDYFRKNKEGEVTDPLDWNGETLGWEDVADLNYDSAEMRLAKINDLKYWLEEFGIDGYRMDIAWRVPLDFWKQASEALVAVNPEIFMVAEADSGDQIYHGYFQACYGWKLHHIMNEVAKGHKNAYNIYDWYYNERKHILNGRIMQFITNHDENSWSGSEYERMGEAAHCLAVLAMTIDGIPLIYNGQEEPLTKRLAFFEKDNIGFEKYTNHDFYKKLVHLKHTQEAIWNAGWGVELHKIGEDEFVMAYKRENENSKVVVILNLANHHRSISLWEGVHLLKELFTGDIAALNAGDQVHLSPYQYLVFHS
jgi:glycosidase